MTMTTPSSDTATTDEFIALLTQLRKLLTAETPPVEIPPSWSKLMTRLLEHLEAHAKLSPSADPEKWETRFRQTHADVKAGLDASAEQVIAAVRELPEAQRDNAGSWWCRAWRCIADFVTGLLHRVGRAVQTAWDWVCEWLGRLKSAVQEMWMRFESGG